MISITDFSYEIGATETKPRENINQKRNTESVREIKKADIKKELKIDESKYKKSGMSARIVKYKVLND